MFDNKHIFNLRDYNLSYDFFKNITGIEVYECYPFKEGFCVVDCDNQKYLLFRIYENDIEKYKQINDILDKIKKNGLNVLGMYSFKSKSVFYDKINDTYYVLFDFGNGNYKKWEEFDINIISETMIKFYDSSKNILDNFENFNLKEDIKILSAGNEIKIIDEQLKRIKAIENMISYKHTRDDLDILFLENKDYILDELLDIRQFFSGYKFKKYLENSKNSRFLIGDISNKSFIFDDLSFNMANFYNSSIDLAVKDVGNFVSNLVNHFEIDKVKNFSYSILREFYGDINEHICVMNKYVRFNNPLLKWFNIQYFCHENIKRYCHEEKIKEFLNYKQNQYDFIKEISFT